MLSPLSQIGIFLMKKRGGMINRRENSPRGNDEPGEQGVVVERMLNECVLADQKRKLVGQAQNPESEPSRANCIRTATPLKRA